MENAVVDPLIIFALLVAIFNPLFIVILLICRKNERSLRAELRTKFAQYDIKIAKNGAEDYQPPPFK